MGRKRRADEEQVLSPRELAENGREVYDWRIVDGRPTLVVVAVGFTLIAWDRESYEDFRARMLRYAGCFTDMEFPVTRLTLVRREEHGKPPYAQFDCDTPEAALPAAADDSSVPPAERLG